MNYKGYFATLEYVDGFDIIHGRVVMPHAIETFQADNIEDLKRELAISMEDYFAWCREEGRAPQPPESSRLPLPESLTRDDPSINTLRLEGQAARLRYDEARELFVGQTTLDGQPISFEGESVAELKVAFARAIDEARALHRQAA